jgi:peptidylprolyl isomerase
VANSRRRERELARRRYERRRLREQQVRAQRRRRNTIIGASLGTAVVIGLVVWLAVANSGGSDKTEPAAQPSATVTPSASATPSAAPAGKCADIKPNPPAKGQPRVPPVKGDAPTKLVIKDIEEGQGPAAKKGDTVSVTYIGVACSTGQVFDASYKHGNEPFPVEDLGSASVIQGWNEGLIGVKKGGVRELIIPPDLGYGPQGSPPSIGPDETLIFLITVESVKA